MRVSFAHNAVVEMAPAADERAPGGAITIALCGHWEHEPPCPLAAHYTGVERSGDEVRLRILFACEPEDETTVRERIAQALSDGELQGVRWRLRSSEPGDVLPGEEDHAARLRNSPPGNRE